MPITAIARAQLAPFAPQWLTQGMLSSKTLPTLSLPTAAPSFEDYLLQDPGNAQHFKGQWICIINLYRKSGNVIPLSWSTTLNPKRFLSIIKHRMNLHDLKPPTCKLSGFFYFPTWCGNKAEVQAYSLDPKKNAPHQNWAKLFEDKEFSTPRWWVHQKNSGPLSLGCFR